MLPVKRFSILLFLTIILAGCASHSGRQNNAQGLQLFSEGNYDSALRSFEDAISAKPDDPTSYYNIASTNHQLAKTTRLPEHYSQAETYYRLALSKNTNFAAAYRNLAVLCVESGREKEAFDLLTAWTLLYPNNAEPKLELARLYEEYGRHEDAANCVAAAYTNEPNNARVLRAYGYLSEKSGDSQQALTAYKESVRVNPQQEDVAARIAYLESNPR